MAPRDGSRLPPQDGSLERIVFDGSLEGSHHINGILKSGNGPGKSLFNPGKIFCVEGSCSRIVPYFLDCQQRFAICVKAAGDTGFASN